MTSRYKLGSQGFTLIEVLVVLTIISLLLALVPIATAGIGGVRFRRAAREMTATLRELQAASLGSGQDVTVTINPSDRLWRSSLDQRTYPVPASIDAVQLHFLAPGIASPVLHFLPDGSASAVTLTLSGSGRTAVILIDGTVGRITLED